MKHLILSILFCLFAVNAQSAVLVLSPNGTYTTKVDITSAISSTDTVGKTIVITSPYIISTAIAWPSNRELKFEKGGYITFTGAGALTGLKETRPEWFGPCNGGDDTTALQNAINSLGSNGTLTGIGNYNVTKIDLKSDMTFLISGTLTQTTAAGIESFNIAGNQDSDHALINIVGKTNITVSMRSTSNYEAIRIINSSNIVVKDSSVTGNRSPSGFPGIMMYVNNNVQISNTSISLFGPLRTSLTYQNGTGIRSLGTTNLKIRNCTIKDNGENGIFTTGSSQVSIRDNYIARNGMSGIQIAFDGTGSDRQYIIDGNYFDANYADACDINNGAYTAYNINTRISNNRSIHTGFVGSLPDGTVGAISTADGSGIATLVNVNNVVMDGNYSIASNRPVSSVSGCDNITFSNNSSDNHIEVKDTNGRIDILDNNVTLVQGITGMNIGILNIMRNTLTTIGLPNSVTIGKLNIEGNKLTECNININLTGDVNFSHNITTRTTGASSLYIVSATSLLIDNNTMSHTSTMSDCISITTALRNITISNNNITSKSICISDVSSPYLLVYRNNLNALAGGYIPARTFSGTVSNAIFRHNTHNSAANALKLTTGTAFIDRDEIVTGSNDFGTATVLNASYL